MSETRGRPRKRNPEVILEVLLKYKNDIVLEKGKICWRKCAIWTAISNELSKRKVSVSESSLYSYVTCNINNIRKELTSKEDFKKVQENILVQEELQNQECPRDSDVFQNVLPSIRKVKIHFNKSEMDALFVKKSSHNTREKVKVKKGEDNKKTFLEAAKWQTEKWQSEVTTKLLEKARVKCSFKVSELLISSATGEGKFAGCCKCGTKIDGKIAGK